MKVTKNLFFLFVCLFSLLFVFSFKNVPIDNGSQISELLITKDYKKRRQYSTDSITLIFEQGFNDSISVSYGSDNLFSDRITTDLTVGVAKFITIGAVRTEKELRIKFIKEEFSIVIDLDKEATFCYLNKFEGAVHCHLTNRGGYYE